MPVAKTKNHRGGKREGAGRPKGRVFSATVLLSMTEAQKARLLVLGGSKWVREKIAESWK